MGSPLFHLDLPTALEPSSKVLLIINGLRIRFMERRPCSQGENAKGEIGGLESQLIGIRCRQSHGSLAGIQAEPAGKRSPTQ